MSLLVLCECRVRTNREAEFLRVARALASAAATEPGTLRYQWFIPQKTGHYSILLGNHDGVGARMPHGSVTTTAMATRPCRCGRGVRPCGSMQHLARKVRSEGFSRLGQDLRPW